MKKKIVYLVLLHVALQFFFGCASSGKLINSNTTVEAKEQVAVSSADLKALEKANERSKRIVEQVDNKITYSFDLIDELSRAIALEKQQAFDKGYLAGKKDAEEAMKGYIKLEDVEKLLKEKGLLKEEKEKK